MKITEQTLRELLADPHAIAELIEAGISTIDWEVCEPPHMVQRRADIAKLFEGVKPYDYARRRVN